MLERDVYSIAFPGGSKACYKDYAKWNIREVVRNKQGQEVSERSGKISPELE